MDEKKKLTTGDRLFWFCAIFLVGTGAGFVEAAADSTPLFEACALSLFTGLLCGVLAAIFGPVILELMFW